MPNGEKRLVKAGLDLGLSSAIPGFASLFELIEALIDPSKSQKIDRAITAHVLSELPRMKRLLEERIADVEASGCTLPEAQVVAYQTIEAQKRALDGEKRRLLANVLVNGLTSDDWDKARHRLFIRFASELEPEHIHLLRRHVELLASSVRRTTKDPARSPDTPKNVEATEVRLALLQELVARGLLAHNAGAEKNPVYRHPDAEHEKKMHATPLGSRFIRYLRDPEDL